jgi:hypothetical protein
MTKERKKSPIPEEFTEGEAYISEFFKEIGIKAKAQAKLENLKGDNKAYRLADFHIPRYNLYLEFLGQWNVSDDAKARYREKKQIYTKNNIPCIYIYPENLGIIEHAFNYRAKDELKKFKMTKELFLFRKDRFMKDRGDLFFWLLLSTLVLFLMEYKTHPENNALIVGVLISIIVYQLWRLLRGYMKYFKND